MNTTIKRQMDLTDRVMKALSDYGYEDFTVAGGAPRDWWFGTPATDVDIYLGRGRGMPLFSSAPPVNEYEIGKALEGMGVTKQPVQLGSLPPPEPEPRRIGLMPSTLDPFTADACTVPENYRHNNHLIQVIEVEVEGQVFQFMDVYGATSLEASLGTFPFNMCMAQYLGEGNIAVTDMFNKGAEEGVLIKTREVYEEHETYVKKVKSKFPHYKYYPSIQSYELSTNLC